VKHALIGKRARHILWFVAPTIIAVVMDFAIRAKALLVYPPLEILNYTGSSLASAGFWGGPLWLASRLFYVRGDRKKIAARIGIGLFFGLFVLPLAVFCFAGQAIYHRVFASYMARDTVRLGIALRGTLSDWLFAWGSPLVVVFMLAVGVLVTVFVARGARKAGRSVRHTWPLLPIIGFCGSAYCFWIDFVESRSLQAAPPDTCFIHGVMHALHDGASGKGWVRRGISLRSPAALPKLTPPEHRPNVLVVLTESVRADASCSDPPPTCTSQFLDEVAADRVPLGRLTTQSPGTFSACMLLWTGLPPTVDYKVAHQAPVLWEIAKAEGYATGYVTSQNLRYDDFGAFVSNAGIDVLASAMDLGATKDAQIGAPDERATARMLDFVRDAPKDKPYFGVLHFSNTHAPYRIDPSLQPYGPHAVDPLGDASAFHNHYLNSVRMQERTLAAFLKELRAMPRWDDTVVLFLSDHGEQFREHGGLYHIHTLYEEEVRIPGWIISGENALTKQQRFSLKPYSHRRTYSQDVTATIVDLLGAFDDRSKFPFADLTNGRSLVRLPSGPEPTMPLATATGVWEPDSFEYGVMRGDHLLVGSPAATWSCFDITRDPREYAPHPASACGSMVVDARRAFPGIVKE
jgi:hypothetical protein